MCHLLGFGLLLWFAPITRADSPPPVADVLGQVRQATGYARFAALPRGFLLRGTTKYLGIDGEFELLCNAQGHFLRTTKHRMGEVLGFDGTQCWHIEQGQFSRILELEDREVALASNWVMTGHWLAEKSPFDIAVLNERTNDKTVALSLKLKQGWLSGTILIDRTTWLPLQFERLSSIGKSVWRYEDYRGALGLQIPHKVSFERANMVNTTTLREVLEAPTFLRNPFALLPVKPSDVTFDPAMPAEVKVERLRSGHLVIPALVDGKDLGWFILDSGAGGMVIDKLTAQQAGLEVFGEIPVVGIGGIVPGRFRQGKSFQVGPVTWQDPIYVEVDLSAVSMALGRKIVGICGAPLFKRTVVEIEATEPRLTLHDPEKYKLEGGTWLPLTLKGNLPCVKARFEGDREALFRVDTGAGGTVTFHTPAVATWKLLDGRATQSSLSGGVGGMQQERAGLLDWFELAGHRFDKPRVTFSQAKTGAFADEYLAGNIGAGFLTNFKLVFDYPHSRLALVKKAEAAGP